MVGQLFLELRLRPSSKLVPGWESEKKEQVYVKIHIIWLSGPDKNTILNTPGGGVVGWNLRVSLGGSSGPEVLVFWYSLGEGSLHLGDEASLEGRGGEPGIVDVISLDKLEVVSSVEIGKQAGGIAFWKMED